MEDYILTRLRIDAAHALAMASNESRIQHAGLKGRLREILVANMLAPWLPPYVACGTGMIISAESVQRHSTQDDIVIYDKSLVPPVLASRDAPEGVFLFNSVLARVEVKSTLSRDEIRRFVKASIEISRLRLSTSEGFAGEMTGALNMLFAYQSDATGPGNQEYQLERIVDVMKEEHIAPEDAIISVVCMPGYGLWKIARRNDGSIGWHRLDKRDPRDHLAWFVALVSSTCFQEHAKRQGRDPSLGVEGGIGRFIPGGSDIWKWVK